jgi:hypothetical protein
MLRRVTQPIRDRANELAERFLIRAHARGELLRRAGPRFQTLRDHDFGDFAASASALLITPFMRAWRQFVSSSGL